MQKSVNNSNPPATKKNFPVGMVFVGIYILYAIVMTLLGIQSPVIRFGPFVFGEQGVVFYSLASVIILLFSFWGLIKRKKWSRVTILCWFVFWIVLTLLNFVFIFNIYKEGGTNPNPQYAFEESKLMFKKIIILIFSFTICIYVFAKSKFFNR